MAKTRSPQTAQAALWILTATVIGVVVITCLYWAQAIFIPLAMALFLTFLLAPLVTRLQRWGLGRATAVVSSLLFALLVAAGVVWVVALQLGTFADRLPGYYRTIETKVQPFTQWVEGFSNRFEQAVAPVTPADGDGPDGLSPARPQTVIAKPEAPPWLSRLPSYLLPVAHFLGGGALALVLTGFMLFKREDLRDRFIRVVGRGQVTVTTRALDDAAYRISRFLRVQALISAFAGASIGLGLLVMGVEYALLWGLLVFVLRYVPYIGIWFAAVPPILLSFATSDGWAQPLFVVGWIFVIEMLCGNVLEPWLFGHSIGVSEVSLLVAAAFWAFLWGPIGMVLSSPLTVCLVVLGHYHPRLKFLSVLLGNEPALEPRMKFYQRLLARDQDEAAEIVQEQLKDGTPALQLYDELFVPALVNARRDVEAEDLPEEAEAFLLEATREIGDELAVHVLKQDAAAEGGAGPRFRLLGCPAADTQDEAALHLLTATLGPAAWEARVLPAGEVYSALLNWADEPPDLICVAVLPPGGLAHTRHLCRRLKARFPAAEIVVARWGQETSAEAAEGLTQAGAKVVTTTFLQTREEVMKRAPAAAAVAPSREERAAEPVGAGKRRGR